MKKYVLLILFAFAVVPMAAQVGIGTTDPKSQLDIPAANPASPTIFDGILIPRVNNLSAVPTADQNGMMVFLTTLFSGNAPGFYYWDNASAIWKPVGGGTSGWGLTGNSGTNPATNFVGTTDANDLIFKRNNVQSGKLNPANTSFGVQALNPANSGVYNVAFGAAALANNTSGHSNTAHGSYALNVNTGGTRNTAVGTNAMYYNQTGEKNTGIGNNTLNANTTGNNNVAVGSEGLSANTTGNNNTTIGFEAGKSITGSNNISIGANTGVVNPAGNNQMNIGQAIYGLDMDMTSFSKIGIAEPNPKAKLHIGPAANPSMPTNADGIIISRVNNFCNPASMTADQNGMMVFLTTAVGANQPGFYYWDQLSTSWKPVGGSGTAGWGLTGNSGTVDGTNFIGTNDDVALSFKVNGKKSGRIEGVNYRNTFMGYESGLSNTPTAFQGINNAGFGYQTLRSNTTGFQNTAIGRDAMYSNVNGSDNTALGFGTLSENTAGSNNVAVGSAALYANQGSDNIAVGSIAMTLNSTGYSNVAVGSSAMNLNDDGYQNVAVGSQALSRNVSGYSNTAVGYMSLQNNEAAANTAVGGYSLSNNFNGQNNVAMGVSAAYNNNGNNNTAVGVESLMTNTNGTANTAIGRGALGATTGSNNTALGNNAGANVSTGSNNIAVGSGSNVPIAANSNQMSIGNVVYGIGMDSGTTSKVGINEPAPNAKMQISASSTTNPNNADGILIPRISVFPLVNPGALQNGMMVFLTTVAGTNQPGFYYWDNASATWKGIGARTDGAFYEVGTVIQPDAITDNMYHTGNIGVGKITANYKLDVEETSGAKLAAAYFKHSNPTSTVVATEVIRAEITAPAALASGVVSGTTNAVTVANSVQGYGTTNYLSGTTTDAVYGASNNVSAIGTGLRYGTTNVMTGTGTGQQVGTRNSMRNITTSQNIGVENSFPDNHSGFGTRYGVSNSFAGGSGGITYGVYSTFSSATGTGWKEGVHNSFSATLPNGTRGVVNAFSGNQSGQLQGVFNDFYTPGVNSEQRGFENGFYNQSGSGNRVGLHNNFGTDFEGKDNSNFYGVYNKINVEATGKKYGTYNHFFFTNTLPTLELYGSYTNFAATSSGTRYGNYVTDGGLGNCDKYGYYVAITSGNPGAQYGYYGNVSSTSGYVGYYLGKNYASDQQITANGDGQSVYQVNRSRDTRNDGGGYDIDKTNRAVGARNIWGDLYTFGVAGYSDNDFNRTGGVLGAVTGGAYWASLGYMSSSATAYGIYSSAAGYAQGAGRLASGNTEFSIGGGFYGGMIGSWSKGNRIGSISSGSLFASYNSGDEYTAGKQVELVDTGTAKTAAYTVTSTEVIVYKKGKITLANGVARVNFDPDYVRLLGDVPVVTTTPMGQCNGIYIESVDKTGFIVRELNNGASNVTVSWIAVGDRVDANTAVRGELLDKDFDNNINEVMFNENDTNGSGKAIWSDGRSIQTGKLPANLAKQPEMNKEVVPVN